MLIDASFMDEVEINLGRQKSSKSSLIRTHQQLTTTKPTKSVGYHMI